MSEYGYAGKILKVDLSQRNIVELPTSEYAGGFIGGRGMAAKIYWDEVSSQVKALDPENYIMFLTGPLAGFTRLAGSRWQICGKSPFTDPERFLYSNVGGSWGAWLKFAGYDGVIVTGCSDKPVYIFIQDGNVEIKDASYLWGKTTIETRETLKNELGPAVRVVALSPAGENLVPFATLLADDDSGASGGFGCVMGSKKLKAIAVAGNKKPVAANPELLNDLSDSIFRLRKGTWEAFTPAVPGRTKRQACYGCITGCIRETYTALDGEKGKFFCQSADLYRKYALKYYGNWTDVIFYATRLCDKYGLCTFAMEPMIEWLSRCYENGILSEQDTGIPLSKIGSYEFIEILVKKIALREGFGNVLARGTLKAAKSLGTEATGLIGDLIVNTANEVTIYDPRIYVITGLLYATEARKPIQQLHEIAFSMLQWLDWLKGKKERAFLSSNILKDIAEKFWGGVEAVDFFNYEGKAIAAKLIQDRTYVKESLILCDFLWPILWVRYGENHVGDSTFESEILSAVTGREINEVELNKIGEKIFNLQRAIFIRDGHKGREEDCLLDCFYTMPIEREHFNSQCLVPDKDGTPLSKKGSAVHREDFEKMKDEYYKYRGWDVSSGLQTEEKLIELGLGDILEDLKTKRLVI